MHTLEIIPQSEENNVDNADSINYELRCSRDCRTKNCEEIIISFFRITNKFIIAVESPSLYNFAFVSEDQETIVYRREVPKFKELMFECFISLRHRKYFNYFNELAQRKPRYF